MHLSIPTFDSPQTLSVINHTTEWHTKTPGHFISISYLAQEVTVLFSTSNHKYQKSNKLLKVCGQFFTKWSSSMKTDPILPHHAHTYTPTHANHEMMSRDDMWFGKFPRFIFVSHEIDTQLKDFCTNFVFTSFCFCFPHLHMFASTTHNFLDALQLFVFSAYLTISLNLAQYFTWVHSTCGSCLQPPSLSGLLFLWKNKWLRTLTNLN